MTANELRIGNLIQVEAFKPVTTEIATVTHISADEIQCQDSRGSTLITESGLNVKEYGIELTPEWLERFGAIFPYTDKIRLQIGELCFYYSGSGGLFLNDSGWNEAISDHQIYHVHELQNLYFSLTSKELTLDK